MITYGGKIFVALVLSLVIVASGLVVNLINQQRLIDLSEQNAQLNVNSDALLRIMLATTGCKLTDTPKQCRATADKISQDEGERRIEVVACVTHRITHGASEEAAIQQCLSRVEKETNGN